MTNETRSALAAGAVQLAVAVIGGLAVWYVVVEVKIAKAEAGVAENAKDIQENKVDIRGLKEEQKLREQNISNFYKVQWPRVGENSVKIEAIQQHLLDLKNSQDDNRKILMQILRKVK